MVHLGYRSAFIIRFTVLCAHESYPSNIFQLYNPMWDPNRSRTRQPLRVSAVGVPPPATDFHGFPGWNQTQVLQRHIILTMSVNDNMSHLLYIYSCSVISAIFCMCWGREHGYTWKGRPGHRESWARSAKCVQHPTASGLEPWSKASHAVACR
jgi:hypothetical protein